MSVQEVAPVVLVYPLGHVVQLLLPAVAVNVPGRQASALVASSVAT